MTSQRRLRLRQPGRHSRQQRHADIDWVWRKGLAITMCHAFEMNVDPKHSHEPPRHHTMNYVTGETVWHGPTFDVSTGVAL